MSKTNNDSHKKSTSVLEKLGQKITNIKTDIADNIERRKNLHNTVSTNQIHCTTRPAATDEPLATEKKFLISFENQLARKYEVRIK
ncbi:unnamed protein product [Rotaria magnacalcarata]|uniref:Uncharacterized protein n=2 Tax=Rotaria magnacalcarata TaxID=392030 RepID=A0A820KNY3_9BILA|nr:unnamed protein product [Rotaria magnacalcarata]CAF4544331.1 unnamed protein product [Rotaria magnacalcarata]CAF4557098.1 unnamed protein product [Rotaria magnacalcarata]